MADLTLLPLNLRRKRPTLIQPVLPQGGLDRILRDMDAQISVLRQIVSAMQLHFATGKPVDDDDLSALEESQSKLRRQHEELCALM